MKRFLVAVGRLVVGVSLVAGSVALTVIAVPLSHYNETPSSASVAISTVAVVQRSTDFAQSGSLVLAWTAERSVPLGIGTGLITSVLATPGQPVQCWQPVVEIDGRARLALCGDRPLWRSVDGATRGLDADELLPLLQIDVPSLTGKATTSQRRQAITRLQKRLTWKQTGALTPDDFVWIGAPFTPTGSGLEPGQPATAASKAFIVGSQLASARLVSPPNMPPSAGAVVAKGIDGASSFPLDASGAATDLGILAKAVQNSSTSPLPGSLAVIVALSAPISVLAVPATSIISTSSGECVDRVEGDTVKTIAVTVVYSEVGEVYVTGALNSGQRILTAPERSGSCS